MFFFLDAGGAGLFYIFLGIGLLFLALAILVEALVMMMLNYVIFRTAIWQSLIVNLLSVIVGYFMIEIAADTFNIDQLTGLTAMFLVTLFVEFIGLYLLNMKLPLRKTIITVLVMNLVTYLILFLFTVLPGS